MPVSLHKKKEPSTIIKEWFNENYPTLIGIAFILQVVGLFWIGTILTYNGV